MTDNKLELDVELIRKRLASAGDEIAGSRSPAFLRVGRKSGRRFTGVGLAIAAMVATTSVGFAGGRVTAPLVGPHVHVVGLSTLPPDVQQALNLMQQLAGPQFSADVTSAEAKYVTDSQLWHAVFGAWKHNNSTECNTFAGPSGATGHVYVVVLHGKFTGPSIPGPALPTEVVVVPAVDWRLDVTSGGQVPTTSQLVTYSASFENPPLGPDGEPLCWSSLPSQ